MKVQGHAIYDLGLTCDVGGKAESFVLTGKAMLLDYVK